MKFKEKIRNKPGPFVPKIKEKPHSLKPLAILLELNDTDDEEFSHPYELELECFTPDQKFMAIQETVAPFQKVQETPLVMVETEEDLKSLLADLSKQTVISVDLEVFTQHRIRVFCVLMINILHSGSFLPIVSRHYLLDANFNYQDRLHCRHTGIVGSFATFK